MAQQRVANRQQAQELETKALIQAQQLTEAALKVTYDVHILQTKDTLPITVIAKE